ncbi:MAG: hypothetical protein V4693_01065 [Pseudomonadota bacterium]
MIAKLRNRAAALAAALSLAGCVFSLAAPRRRGRAQRALGNCAGAGQLRPLRQPPAGGQSRRRRINAFDIDSGFFAGRQRGLYGRLDLDTGNDYDYAGDLR